MNDDRNTERDFEPELRRRLDAAADHLTRRAPRDDARIERMLDAGPPTGAVPGPPFDDDPTTPLPVVTPLTDRPRRSRLAIAVGAAAAAVLFMGGALLAVQAGSGASSGVDLASPAKAPRLSTLSRPALPAADTAQSDGSTTADQADDHGEWMRCVFEQVESMLDAGETNGSALEECGEPPLFDPSGFLGGCDELDGTDGPDSQDADSADPGPHSDDPGSDDPGVHARCRLDLDGLPPHELDFDDFDFGEFDFDFDDFDFGEFDFDFDDFDFGEFDFDDFPVPDFDDFDLDDFEIPDFGELDLDGVCEHSETDEGSSVRCGWPPCELDTDTQCVPHQGCGDIDEAETEAFCFGFHFGFGGEAEGFAFGSPFGPDGPGWLHPDEDSSTGEA